MRLYDLKIKSYLGADTRIQVVKVGNPKKEAPLDRNSKTETEDFNPNDNSEERQAGTRRGSRVRSSRLSTNGKAILQRVGGAVSDRFHANQSVFLTGTFPGSNFSAQSAIASQSNWIVHRLKAWLYKRLGANIGYYVWEFQKRGTLHLHYVVVVPDSSARSQIIRDFREEWIRLIRGASIRSGCDLFQGEKGRNYAKKLDKLQIYAQECYKSAASYLAKYLSRDKTRGFIPPTRLWGATQDAKRLVAEGLITLEVFNKSLAKVSEMAYEHLSWSDTPVDKVRQWRHRFSEGFTILVYNEAYRMELSVMEDKAKYSNRTSSVQKAQVLRDVLIGSHLMDYLSQKMTRVGWFDLRSLLYPESSGGRYFDPQSVVIALVEARALIVDSNKGGFRARYDCKNKIAVLIMELSDEFGLPIMQSGKVDSEDGARRNNPADTVEEVHLPREQLSMFGA